MGLSMEFAAGGVSIDAARLNAAHRLIAVTCIVHVVVLPTVHTASIPYHVFHGALREQCTKSGTAAD